MKITILVDMSAKARGGTLIRYVGFIGRGKHAYIFTHVR